jgi:glutathione S-transferase
MFMRGKGEYLMKDKITVYSYRRCPFAIRVRMTLNEKSVPYVVQEEDLKNFSENLKIMHPEAKVPVLVHVEFDEAEPDKIINKEIIYESAVITEYIDEAFDGGRKLMPASAKERMRVRLLTYWCNQLFKPDVDKFKYGTSRFPEEECEGVSLRLQNHLKKLSGELSGKPFILGDEISLADIHLFPFYRQLSRSQGGDSLTGDLSELNAWLERITTREAFVKTMAKS